MEVCAFCALPVLHLSSPVPAQTFSLSESIWCGLEDLSKKVVAAALERKYSVWIGESIRIGSTHPEGTKLEHGRLGTASRGSNCDVAIIDDHEL